MAAASLPASNHATPSTDAWKTALCRNFDPEAWFPDSRQFELVAAAKEVCGLCPLRFPCAEYGMSAEYGIYGGLDEFERRALRRRTNRAPKFAHKVAS